MAVSLTGYTGHGHGRTGHLNDENPREHSASYGGQGVAFQFRATDVAQGAFPSAQ